MSDTKGNSIILATDSRGRSWAEELEKSSKLPPNTRVIRQLDPRKIGGAKLEELYKFVRIETGKESYLHPQNKIIIVISGGICNITTRKNGQVYLEEKANKAKYIIDILQNIWEYCEQRRYILVITTILPVSLINNLKHNISKRKIKKSRFSDQELLEQEIKTNQIVEEVNKFIVTKSKEVGNVYIEFVKNVQNRVLRKRKNGNTSTRKPVTVISRLYDGVHADHQLQKKLCTKVINACKLVLIPVKRKAPENTITTEESESETEPWQEKRARYHQ